MKALKWVGFPHIYYRDQLILPRTYWPAAIKRATGARCGISSCLLLRLPHAATLNKWLTACQVGHWIDSTQMFYIIIIIITYIYNAPNDILSISRIHDKLKTILSKYIHILNRQSQSIYSPTYI